MPSPIFENSSFRIEIEPNAIPWVKIFTVKPYQELSELPKALRLELYELTNIIEEIMIELYHPTKINIASFGNYMPHVHMHVMARFESDAFFPEPMWGEKQRDSVEEWPIEPLIERLKESLA